MQKNYLKHTPRVGNAASIHIRITTASDCQTYPLTYTDALSSIISYTTVLVAQNAY